jgi:orotidine-5'-phosphate decarboxylase
MAPPTAHFADALIERTRALGHPLCVGLDPHLDRIPPLFRRGSMSPRDPETAAAVGEFVNAVIERLDGRVAAVKPQIAFFESLGWSGLEVLSGAVARAHSLGLTVVLDAKRGDIGSTAEAYAAAYLDSEAPMEVDAITLNPYLGRDTLQPFVERCQRFGRGIFVLVKTSNPGSADYQGLLVDGAPLHESVAASLADEVKALEGPETHWSSLGVVVGATYPGEAERIRELLPRALFLVPGYGAQGASAAAALRGFASGPAGLEGGIVNSSRGILFPDAADTQVAAVWERAVDTALSAACDELGSAVSA